MRRIFLPGGGWLLLAALVVPVVLTSAKPLAKKLGKGLRDIGEKLMEDDEDRPSTKSAAAGAKPKAERAQATEKKPAAGRRSSRKKPAARKKPVNTPPKE